MLIAQQKFQIADTEVDVRLIEVETAQILFSAYGKGHLEKKITAGAAGGGSGGYDETMAGDCLRLAINESVHDLNNYFLGR
jgi:curli biogenesis system outer membrane secretion channel CsgG